MNVACESGKVGEIVMCFDHLMSVSNAQTTLRKISNLLKSANLTVLRVDVSRTLTHKGLKISNATKNKIKLIVEKSKRKVADPLEKVRFEILHFFARRVTMWNSESAVSMSKEAIVHELSEWSFAE